MGSGSRSCGSGSHTEAPSMDNSLIAPQLNPEFEAMPGAEIVAHLSHSHCTADFVDATRVLVARERRLAEAMAQIHHKFEILMGLQAEIHTLELKVANAEARARHGSGISGHKLMHQASAIKEAYGEGVDHEVVEDVLGARVITGHKVPKDEAQGKDTEASCHICSQGEQPTRATKKARKQKEPCFYNMVFTALKEKQDLQQQKWNEEAITKEAAATASKPPCCRCWWSNAPYMPSESAAVKEDSNDGLNDS